MLNKQLLYNILKNIFIILVIIITTLMCVYKTFNLYCARTHTNIYIYIVYLWSKKLKIYKEKKYIYVYIFFAILFQFKVYIIIYSHRSMAFYIYIFIQIYLYIINIYFAGKVDAIASVGVRCRISVVKVGKKFTRVILQGND